MNPETSGQQRNFHGFMRIGGRVKPHDKMPLLAPRLLTNEIGCLVPNPAPVEFMNDEIFAANNLVHTEYSTIAIEHLVDEMRPDPTTPTFVYMKACRYDGVFANCHQCWRTAGAAGKRKNFSKPAEAPFPGRVNYDHPNLLHVGMGCGCVICNECFYETKGKIAAEEETIPCVHCGHVDSFPRDFRFWIIPRATMDLEEEKIDANEYTRNWKADHLHYVGGGPY
jgi:hypothetical protein